MFIGSQNTYNNVTEKVEINKAIRVNVNKLAKILEANKLQIDIKTRLVGGSTPPRNARVWTEWNLCGYKCVLGDRSAGGRVSHVLDSYHIKITFPFSQRKSSWTICYTLKFTTCF